MLIEKSNLLVDGAWPGRYKKTRECEFTVLHGKIRLTQKATDKTIQNNNVSLLPL
jgi:hypothetical protein